MGQESSQPVKGTQNVQAEEQDTYVQVPDSQPEASNAGTQPNGDTQNGQESVRKRKRISSIDDLSPQSLEAASQPNEESHNDQEAARRWKQKPLHAHPETQALKTTSLSNEDQGESQDSHSLKGLRNSAIVDTNMAPAQSFDVISPQTKRQRLVDSLHKKSASQHNGSTQPDASKAQNKPSKKRKSQGSQVEPQTPKKKVAQRDAGLSKFSVLATPDALELSARFRPKPTAKGAVGQFEPTEVEALESFKLDFCNLNNCSTMTFDQMVQHGRQEIFPGHQWISKKAFWKSAFDVLPSRDKRSVLRFMKRHFQASDQKAHVWTEDQDAELVALVEQHGTKFAFIAEIIGRSSDDVVQRWKNRLEHRDRMKTGPWSKDELKALQDALTVAWRRSKEQGLDVGESFYDMDESFISWGQVSKSMGHIRSRQQCADKWRRNIKRHSTGGSLPNSRSTTPAGRSKRKSDHYIQSDGDDSDGQEGDANSQNHDPTPAQLKRKSPTKEKRIPRRAESSSDSESSSGSEADSEPKGASGADSSSSSESESEEEQGAAKNSNPNSKSGSGSKDKGSAQSRGKTPPVKKPQPDSSSRSETDESTTDESSDSSSEDSGSTDESENESENETSSAKPTKKETQISIKRMREGSAEDDQMKPDPPAKIIKKEHFSDDEFNLQNGQQNDEERANKDDDDETSDEESGEESDDSAKSGPDSKDQKDIWFTSKVKAGLSDDTPIRKREW
ncbi:hypothetical protein BJX64DRAFT_246176 [Aspergillus heterothallicus]